MGCSLPCLKSYSMAVGTVLMLLSVAGIGFCLFMLFGEPFAIQTQDTYAPNWEDLGRTLLIMVFRSLFYQILALCLLCFLSINYGPTGTYMVAFIN